jgi:thymidylate synthase
MTNLDESYLGLVSSVLAEGAARETRAGPTRQAFGAGLVIDCMREGKFPIITSRKIFWKPVLGELAAFLRGAVDLKTFKDFGCNYWDANANAWEYNQRPGLDAKYVGQIYGAQWRKWQMYDDCDQLTRLVSDLKTNPGSRRHLLTAYDPYQDWQCLPPCHLMAQFNVDNDNYLDCAVYMRSVDLCLGLPSDIILYATLMLLVGQETGYKPGNLIFMLGDTHIYENHIDVFKKQRTSPTFELPTWELDPNATIDTFEPKHLNLINYTHGEKLEYPIDT